MKYAVGSIKYEVCSRKGAGGRGRGDMGVVGSERGRREDVV
jgi:hypothetical protein